jgi:hypothetical protein
MLKPRQKVERCYSASVTIPAFPDDCLKAGEIWREFSSGAFTSLLKRAVRDQRVDEVRAELADSWQLYAQSQRLGKKPNARSYWDVVQNLLSLADIAASPPDAPAQLVERLRRIDTRYILDHVSMNVPDLAANGWTSFLRRQFRRVEWPRMLCAASAWDFVSHLLDKPLPASSPEAKIGVLLVPVEGGRGIVAWLTLERVEHGTGHVYPGLVFNAFLEFGLEFEQSINNAVACLRNQRIWPEPCSFDVRWTLRRADGAFLDSIDGPSLGLAFALGLGKVSAPVCVEPDELAKALMALDMHGVAASARVLPSGQLEIIGEQFEKIRAAARDGSWVRFHTVLLAERQPLDPGMSAAAGLHSDPNGGFDVLARQTFPEAVLDLRRISTKRRMESDHLFSLFRPISFDAEIRKHGPTFYGRLGLIDQFRVWISENAAPRILWIAGLPGIGKTALAVHLCLNERIAAFHLCRSGDQDKASPRRCVLSLAYQLADHIEEYRRQLRMLNLEEITKDAQASTLFDRLIVQPLARVDIGHRNPMAILIDGLDEARDGSTNELVDLIRMVLPLAPPWLRVVVTSRPDPDLVLALSGLPVTTVRIDSHSEAHRLDLQGFVRVELNRVAPGHPAIGEAVAAICSRSEDLFEYAAVVVELIRTGVFSLDRIDEFPRGLRAVYTNWFAKRFPNPDRASELAGPNAASFDTICRPLLEVLAASRDPLRRSEVASALKWDSNRIRSAEEMLGSLFPVDGEVFHPVHNSLLEWLQDPEQADSRYLIDASNGHATLAEHCLRELSSGVNEMSDYAKVHMVSHFAELKRWADIVRVFESSGLDFEALWFDRGYALGGLACLAGTIRHLAETNRRPSLEASLALQLARLHSRRAEYPEAEQWLHYALDRAPRWGGRRIRSVAHHEIGSLALYRSDVQAAKVSFRYAYKLSAFRFPRFLDEIAANLIALATIAAAERRYKHAAKLATRALKQAQAAADFRHGVAARRLLANLCKDDARHEEADEHLVAADLLVTLGRLAREKPSLDLTRGWIEYNRSALGGGTFAAAVSAFTEAMRSAEATGAAHQSLEGRLGMAWCALAIRDTHAAALRLAEMSAGADRIEHHDLAAMRLLLRARIAHQLARWIAARTAYETALKFSEMHDCRSWAASALVGLGSILWHAEQFIEAEVYWKQARSKASHLPPVAQQLIAVSIERCQLDPRVTPL